jgi:hypothetical protein
MGLGSLYQLLFDHLVLLNKKRGQYKSTSPVDIYFKLYTRFASAEMIICPEEIGASEVSAK